MIRMVPFFFIHLLLTALLLQRTEEKKEPRRQKPPEHDVEMHHQEFCLRIPEAPRSTGLHFETPQPTKSEPKLARKKPNSLNLAAPIPRRAGQPDVHRSPMSGEENYPSADGPEIVTRIAPVDLNSPDGHVKVSDGCYCKEQNQKPSIENYQVSGLRILYPSETCRSTEYIDVLKDGREVCATQFSLVAHFFRSLPRWVPKQRSTASPEISSTTHQTTTSTPTRLATTTDGSDSIIRYRGPDGGEYYLEIHHIVKDPEDSISYAKGSAGDLIDQIGPPNFSLLEELCAKCTGIAPWNDFDLKDVQLVDLKLQSSNCPAFISVSLTDGRQICMDSSHPEFQQFLDKLEVKEP
ncbi:uncharacterized protein LOC114158048 [Xiphophorus couchianus]|uniref:uncharacterized protein LOC114156791 n=1 Tax=Xiphophorus couchianus TaxID=32473 RepID=UPI0010161974|nr:uncharacterized protein LOC114156791 [Xiphophorus couchianus]XP_027895166.1 uncharacterized protein LOC114158048 [Xiphophorus couchianus]